MLWKGRRVYMTQSSDVAPDVTPGMARIIWTPGETFIEVLRSELRPVEKYDEFIDHINRMIVVQPETWLDEDWSEDGLTLFKRPFSAAVDTATYDADPKFGFTGAPVWFAIVGGYQVSDREIIERGNSSTLLIYFDAKEYAQRLAQRALKLWLPEVEAAAEQSKDEQIARLTRFVDLLKKERETILMKYQALLERNA